MLRPNVIKLNYNLNIRIFMFAIILLMPNGLAEKDYNLELDISNLQDMSTPENRTDRFDYIALLDDEETSTTERLGDAYVVHQYKSKHQHQKHHHHHHLHHHQHQHNNHHQHHTNNRDHTSTAPLRVNEPPPPSLSFHANQHHRQHHQTKGKLFFPDITGNAASAAAAADIAIATMTTTTTGTTVSTISPTTPISSVVVDGVGKSGGIGRGGGDGGGGGGRSMNRHLTYKNRKGKRDHHYNYLNFNSHHEHSECTEKPKKNHRKHIYGDYYQNDHATGNIQFIPPYIRKYNKRYKQLFNLMNGFASPKNHRNSHDRDRENSINSKKSKWIEVNLFEDQRPVISKSTPTTINDRSESEEKNEIPDESMIELKPDMISREYGVYRNSPKSKTFAYHRVTAMDGSVEQQQPGVVKKQRLPFVAITNKRLAEPNTRKRQQRMDAQQNMFPIH